MAKKIIKDQQIVEDHWIHADAEQPLPEGDVIIPWDRWLSERDRPLKRPGRLGVRINGDVPVEELAKDLGRFDLIELEFPQVKDGRCYSHARLLRDRYGYQGELRAVGEVLRDQIFYMHRVGINAFEVPPERDIEHALTAFQDFDVRYQSASDGEGAPAYRRRHA